VIWLKFVKYMHVHVVCCSMYACVCVYSSMRFVSMAKLFVVIATVLLLSETTLSSVIPPPEAKPRVLEKV